MLIVQDRMLLSVMNPRPGKPGEAGLFCNKTDRNCRLLLDNYRLVRLTSDGKFDNNHSHISIIAAGRRFIERREGGPSTRYTCRVRVLGPISVTGRSSESGEKHMEHVDSPVRLHWHRGGCKAGQ